MSSTSSPDNPQLVTAAQIKKGCPVEVQDLGQRLAAHYDKLIKCEDKAEQRKIAIGQLLLRAKEACDVGGFIAFRERFCPNLGKSRAYELLQSLPVKKPSKSRRPQRARASISIVPVRSCQDQSPRRRSQSRSRSRFPKIRPTNGGRPHCITPSKQSARRGGSRPTRGGQSKTSKSMKGT
jgi:hypothetical protein